jgi:hypothetical protein
LRINRRTQSLAKQSDLAEDAIGQVKNPELKIELEDLATRQQKIYDVTRDIIIKNSKD